jgi:hypothetical protein
MTAGLYVEASVFTGNDLWIHESEGDTDGYTVLQRASEGTWDGLRLEGNTAQTVFAAVEGGSVSMRHTTFTANAQLTSGAGGRLLYIEVDTSELSNLLAYGNAVSSDENLIELRAGTTSWLFNALVYGNTGARAALVVGGATTTAENCIVSQNADARGVVALDGAVVQYTDAWGNNGNFSGDTSAAAPNLEADPKLVNPTKGDFTLLAGFSPAIDAGNPLSGYDDVDGTRNDLGAFGGPYGKWVP